MSHEQNDNRFEKFIREELDISPSDQDALDANERITFDEDGNIIVDGDPNKKVILASENNTPPGLKEAIEKAFDEMRCRNESGPPCETVHPLVQKMMDQFENIYDMEAYLTPLQQQLTACLSVEFNKRYAERDKDYSHLFQHDQDGDTDTQFQRQRAFEALISFALVFGPWLEENGGYPDE